MTREENKIVKKVSSNIIVGLLLSMKKEGLKLTESKAKEIKRLGDVYI